MDIGATGADNGLGTVVASAAGIATRTPYRPRGGSGTSVIRCAMKRSSDNGDDDGDDDDDDDDDVNDDDDDGKDDGDDAAAA
jgi:hypothetical protein